MVSHFLAKGQRVLVAAQTPQALREVRTQLPDEIKDLVVASLGGGKSDNDDLQKAINALVNANENRTELTDGFENFEDENLKKIRELHAERASTIREIINIRAQETNLVEVDGIRGSFAHLTMVYLDRRSEFDWLKEISSPEAKALTFNSSDADYICQVLEKIWKSECKLNSKIGLPKKN